MIDSVKTSIHSHLNQEIKVISKENRNKNDIFYGYITEIYSHVFVVSNGIDKRSYSYADVLSKDILITFL